MKGSLRNLCVEGAHDKYVVIATVKKLRPAWPPDAKTWGGGFNVDDGKGDARAIRDFRLALTLGPDARAGLILDADDHPGKRLADRIALLQKELPALAIPSQFPAAGWISHALPNLSRCGIWLMPDNQGHGALEAFVEPFIPTNDSTKPFAWQSANDALATHGAPYSAKDAAKARLHTWLAWREEPGRPYGRAIEAGDLKPETNTVAQQLADWVQKLFVD